MKHPEILEGEILPPERPNGASVVYSPSPFKRGSTQYLTLPYGTTVLEAVRACGVGPNLMRAIAVYLGDERIDRSVWHVVRPKPGVPLYVRVELQGGGKGGKNPLRAILMLAVVAFAAFAAPALAGMITGQVLGATGITSLTAAKAIFTTAKVLAFAGVASAGTALVNAVAPPPRPPGQTYGFDQQPGNPYASLTGLRNQLAPYAIIPRVFGKRRIYPLLAARPYTESQGNTQFLRLLLLVGYGPIKISDIRIGNTPITAIANAQFEVREGWDTDQPVSLFTRSISEQSLSSLLSPSTPVVQTTATNTTEISVDITFPSGLARFNSNTGAREQRSVVVTVQWSNNGGASWNNAVWIDGNASFGTGTNGQITCTDASAQTVVRSGRFSVPAAGTYQVRLNRTTAAGGQYDVDTAYWTVLRSIRADAPVKMPGLALIAMRLQATAQLSGVPDAINCIAEAYVPTWNGSTWSAPVLSRNPAWAFAHALRYRGQEAIVPDSRIDLTAIKAWADACDATAPNAAEPRWRYDEVVENGSIWTVAQNIASHARARFAVVDGKYSVVRDIEQTVPVQHISPRNSHNYRGSKAFVDIPHAFRVKFPNDAKDNAEDEVIVYRDGYNADGSAGNIAATKFETLALPGCTSPTQAWREGRYHMATLLLRPEEHVVDMDFEHLRCTIGDLVRFSHDVVSIGLGQGRIAGRTVNASNLVVSYDLDNPVEMVVGTTYGIRIRRADGSSVVHVLTTTPGVVSTVTLATPIGLAGAGAIDDLFMFGVSTLETAPMIVKRIDPGPDFTATLTLVDAQSGIYSADTGTIPAFSSYITNQLPAAVTAPPAPSITLRSDETALLRLPDGTLIDRIIVTRAPPGPGAVPIRQWEVQLRRNGANAPDWQQIGIFNPDVPGVAIDNVIAGLGYDVRARTISTGGVASDWTTVTNHVVVGKTTAPATLTGLAVARYLDGNLVRWDLSPEIDVVEYEVRVGGTDWASATFLALTVNNAHFDTRTSFGSLTYRVRARDAIGLMSPEATITANPSAPILSASQVAGFVGQGALATLNAVDLATTQVTNKTANNLTYTAGGTVDSLRPGEAGANVTETRTAAAIASQGPWATTSTALSTVLAPAPNLFPYPSPIYNLYGGSQPSPSTYGWLGDGIEVGYWQPIGGPIYYKARPSGGAAVNNFYFFDVYGIAAGENYTLSAASGGTATPGIYIDWHNSSGAFISSSALATWNATASRFVVTATAPAGAARARCVFRAGWPAGGSLQDFYFSQIKFERGGVMTPLLLAPEVSSRQSGADVTASNTAAAISGQGALATLNAAAWGSQISGRPGNLAALSGGEAINNALVPVGVNGAPNSEFIYNDTFPPLGYNQGGTNSGAAQTYSIVAANERRSIKCVLAGSPGAGAYFDIAYTNAFASADERRRFAFPVFPGQRIAVSWLIARNASVSDAYANVSFFDASMNYLTEIGSSVRPTSATNGDTNDPAAYTLSWLVADVPASARWAVIYPRGITNGGASPTIWAMQPLIARIDAGQTSAPPYSPTAADRRADLTSERTAAAIAGQGALATQSSVSLAGGQVTNKTADNLTYTAGGTVDSLRPQESNANRTETRTAAAISGQGALATLSQVGASRMLLPQLDNVIPDADMRDPSWWGLGGLGSQIDLDGGWTFRRAIAINPGTFDYYSSYFPVQPGATYRIRCRIWNNGGSWSGAVWPMIHMPWVQWFSLRHGTGVDPSISDASNAIVAGADTGELTWYFTNPTGVANNANRQWQFRLKGSFSSVSGIIIAVEITRVARLAETVMRESGALLTDAAAVTSLGTAAAISGQGAWATTGTALATVLAPKPNLFPYPSPIYNVYGGTAPSPSTYGWLGDGIGIGYWQPAGGPIYYKTRPSGGAAATEYYYFRVPNIVAGQSYAVSLNGYVSNSNWGVYIDWLNAGGTWVGASALTLNSTTQRWTFEGTAPAGAATLQLVIRADWSASGSYQDVVFNRIKVEQNTVATPFDDAPEIRARQSGADVTASNTAAAITGQGGLATRSNVGASEIITGSVSTSAAQYNSGSMTVTATYATAATISITAEASDVIDLNFNAEWALTTSRTLTDVGGYWRVVRNGTTVVYETFPIQGKRNLADDVTYGGEGGTNGAFLDTPGAGSHTYTLEVSRSGGLGGAVSKRYLRALRLRR